MHFVFYLTSIFLLAPALVANNITTTSLGPNKDNIVPIATAWKPNLSAQQFRAKLLREQMMLSHNETRQKLGVTPLLWDSGLANDADIYAQYLAKNNLFEHDPQNDPKKTPQGENLWKGTRGAFGYAQMAGGWISEKKLFKRGIFPDVSTDGNWVSVGHYTQIIWKSTTHMGCAIASNKQDDILVCRYSPAGNVMNQDPIGD